MPPAPQLPGDGHDTALTSAYAPLFLVGRPGRLVAACHLYPAWLTTKACCAPLRSVKSPPPVQLPAEAHDTALSEEYPPLFRAASPGSSCAFPQTPPLAVTTNAWVWCERSS